MERYVIRHEYFGGLVYDRVEDNNIMIDEEFYQVLSSLYRKENTSFLPLDVDMAFLASECFLLDGHINYRLIDIPHNDETLSAPGRVHFYYTSRCNLNCAHCFTKNASTENELSFEEKLSLLDQMCDLGVNEILIGGGEPFTVKDFPDFVDESLKRHISTKIYTNGLLIGDGNLIERIADWDLKFLSISIDGADEQEYERIRGVKGLSILKKNIQELKKRCHYKINASVTINRFNYNNAEGLLAIIDEFGFDGIVFRPIKPAGNVLINPDVYLTAEQYSVFLKNAQNIWNKKYVDRFLVKYSWGDTRLGYNSQMKALMPIETDAPYEGYGCYAGKVNIGIDSNGNALTCGFLPEELCKARADNLRQKTLKEIWDSGTQFLKLRTLEGNTTCRICNYYNVCRGGCIVRKVFVRQDIESPDPWCLKKYFPIYL